MSEQKKYTLKVESPEYWQEVHDLLCSETSCEHIPDREVSCFDEKEHSPTRGTFLLTDEEAVTLGNHPHVEWIELDPLSYPEEYPEPSLYEKRWGKSVKVYRDLGAPNNPVSTGATSGELDRTGWQIVRTGITTNGVYWGASTGNLPPTFTDVNYSLTGKNVDVVIHDTGLLQYHPEFLDENGRSRVRDIVLDGPYYIDPDYFDNVIPGVKYTKSDGRVGIATTAAAEWWSNSTRRSVGFSTIGTISISSGYTADRAMGTSLNGQIHLLTSGHGTSSASLVAGKNFGLAFEANIWNMSGIGNPSAMGTSIEQNYDCMKLFHLYKPVNPETGKKNPTLVNGSWGYQAAFYTASAVNYRFRGSTGTFTGNAAVTNQVTAMKTGLNNQVGGTHKSWSSSSRSSSTDTAANEMISAGVLYVAAAGNNNQRLGIGATDVDRLNYMSDNAFGTTDPRPEFPAGTVPCNHRDWMNPQGIGFDSATDFHPVICVGAMDDEISSVTLPLGETKASYSNNGPGIDVWSPADETLAAGVYGVAGYTDYTRADNPLFYDNNFNGTSAAAPVVCGLVALYLQTNPKATSRITKEWLNRHGSVVVGSDLYLDQYPNDTTTTYWTGSFNMRGAERRIIYNPYANDVIPSIDNLNLSGEIKINFAG